MKTLLTSGETFILPNGEDGPQYLLTEEDNLETILESRVIGTPSPIFSARIFRAGVEEPEEMELDGFDPDSLHFLFGRKPSLVVYHPTSCGVPVEICV